MWGCGGVWVWVGVGVGVGVCTVCTYIRMYLLACMVDHMVKHVLDMYFGVFPKFLIVT